MLGVAPERLNAVDMPGSLDELIVAVVDPKVLFQADVNQAIVARPTVGMNDAVGSTLPRIMACSVALEALGTISV